MLWWSSDYSKLITWLPGWEMTMNPKMFLKSTRFSAALKLKLLNLQPGMDISSVHSSFCFTLTLPNVKTTFTATYTKTSRPTNFYFRRFKKAN